MSVTRPQGANSAHERIRAEPVPAAYVLSRWSTGHCDRWAQRGGRAARSGHETGAQGPDGIGLSLPRRQWPVAFRPVHPVGLHGQGHRGAGPDRPGRAHDSGPPVAGGRRATEGSRRGQGGGRAARPHTAGHVPHRGRYRAPARSAPRAAGAAERRDAPVHHQPARTPGAADGERAALPPLQHEAERATAAGPGRG